MVLGSYRNVLGIGLKGGRMELGDAIRIAREKTGMKQRELAAKIGITQSQLSAVESGKRRPSQQQIIDIASAIGDDSVLIYYKYTSDVYKYLIDKYFKTLGFTPQDHADICDECIAILNEIKQRSEVIVGLKDMGGGFRGEFEKIKGLTHRVKALVLFLEESVDDIQFLL